MAEREMKTCKCQESKQRDTCNVTIKGLDAENCYSLWVRKKATQVAYGSDTYPSDWSEIRAQRRKASQTEVTQIHFNFQPGSPGDAARSPPGFMENTEFPSNAHFSDGALQEIVKKCLMPSVADPKSTFPGLFQKYEGNFQQECIRDTQNLAPLSSPAGRDRRWP
ncbi:hypothetical protein P7K49_013126 [Saguinus oedipus]|uniref:Cytokine receptor-like factor 2-like D2 domain-containing protein n=1 Tax=Saguinus oedipus TaxID=9490 RepID=A0ABQ9VFK9_SAGOE|nr:hypothetical protein P7K49_013126 [Saguinus oedipus]